MNQESRKLVSFTDLKAWQEVHKLVLMIYEITKVFLKYELFGLTSQMRRAVVSITSNIAEGFSRQHYSEKVQFYSMAQGSNTELQNQLLVVRDVGYVENKKFSMVADQSVFVHKLLSSLLKKSKTIRDS